MNGFTTQNIVKPIIKKRNFIKMNSTLRNTPEVYNEEITQKCRCSINIYIYNNNNKKKKKKK